ncbi:hypothetical protein [Mucilaginibacter glaciei]|uniref:Bulb-type lectin domain-containing protein n=1 Tax=Mucilaginibacter glaciei TaxID=2772109 RepID=A0A926S279_9SPHI|nr:hypothetical protein [Mucilaginibacter glaciei]MBD1394840.1 hypothetical protein [Mucilaginibacter glaciei]
MQANGNFSITGVSDQPGASTLVWSSNTEHGFDVAYFLIMQNDGNLSVYGGTGPADYRERQWSTGSPMRAEAVPKPPPVPEEIIMGTNMAYPSGTSWGLPPNEPVLQQFRVQKTGCPTNLFIGMGNNQNAYGARIRFLRGTETVFERTYSNLVQRSQDWTTPYPLEGFSEILVRGEFITIELTVFQEVGIEPIHANLEDYPKGVISRSAAAIKFYVEGLSQLETNIDIQKKVDGLVLLQDGETRTVAIGEQMTFSMNTEGEVLETIWVFPPEAIGLWVQSRKRGMMVYEPEVLKLGSSSPTFFYSKKGNYSEGVRWKIRDVHGEVINGEGRTSVWRVTDLEDFRMRCRCHAVAVHRLSGGAVRMQLGSSTIPGMIIKFEAALEAGAFVMELSVIQFVRGTRRYTKADGSTFLLSTGEEWYLDRTDENPEIYYKGRGEDNDSFTELVLETPRSVMMVDNPSSFLDQRKLGVSVNETFRTYLVVRPKVPDPANARWGTVGYVEWSWRASISRPSAEDLWPHEPAESYVTPEAELIFTNTDRLPNWAHDTRELVTKLEIEFADAVLSTPPATGITNARIIEIKAHTSMTGEFKRQVEEVICVPVSQSNGDAFSCLLWAELADANKALSIAGIESVREVEPARRYSLAHSDVRHTMTVDVAPFNLYKDSVNHFKFAEAFSPYTMSELAERLVRESARRYPHTTLSAQIFSVDTVFLNFSSEIDEEFLRWVASYAQGSMAARAQAFRSDDPPPVHDGPLM